MHTVPNGTAPTKVLQLVHKHQSKKKNVCIEHACALERCSAVQERFQNVLTTAHKRGRTGM